MVMNTDVNIDDSKYGSEELDRSTTAASYKSTAVKNHSKCMLSDFCHLNKYIYNINLSKTSQIKDKIRKEVEFTSNTL